MAYALNLHESLFAAIEEKYAENGDLLQLCGSLYRDFVPEKKSDGTDHKYPLVVVAQGQEGGFTEWCVTTEGLEPAEERFAVNFEIVASTVAVAAAIAWQIAANFQGWHGDYEGVKVRNTDRPAPPWAGMTEQGACEASVSFIVSTAVDEE